jgi:DNA-binding transcriptional ArsR family regulator
MTYRLAAVSALGALGDPTRRTIFERLAERPAAVGEIAQGLPVSRPAVSQHLKVLKAAGLVTESAEGTRRIYRIDPRGIGAVRQWLDQFHGQALGAFKAYAEAQEHVGHPKQEPE